MSLIASATALASEKSFVEGYFNSDHKITEDNNEHVIKKTGLKTEINTKNGLSFGLNLEGKDIKIPFEKYAYDNILNNSNIFIKYSIPEKNKVNSYLKATINPKVKRENDTPKYTTSNLELEDDLNISPFEKSKFGINSKTKFEFENDTENYGKHVTSTHKIYFDSKNIKASAEVSHNYDKDATKSLKFVKLNSEIDYDILSSKFNFKYQFNGVSKAKNLLNGDLITLESKDYIHSYEIDLKKKILDDKLELSAGAFIQHHYDNQIQLGDKYAKLSLQNDNDYKEMLKNETKAKK